jgi:hypothetical protein
MLAKARSCRLVKWAINHREEHVRADAPGISYSFELRCPVCRERVFARSGRIREAHFAHYGGNFSKACEQYHPGDGVASGSQNVAPYPVHEHHKHAFGAPALLWRDGQSMPASLYLRLPSTPGGFASNVKVISRATSQFRGKDLAKPAFAGLRLQARPGECETNPRDPALEALINEALSKFRFSDNYFRATGEGGVLEHPDTPLELGEDYWLVTQVALREPMSELLQVYERRSDRTWLAYRIGLPLLNEDDLRGLKDLAAYLQRDVIRPRVRVNLLWPTPDRIDPDGVPVFGTSVSEILVRSVSGIPQCLVQEQLSSGEQVAQDIFAFRFDGKVDEALISVRDEAGRRLRFDTCVPVQPAGVYLHVDDHRIPAFDPNLSEMLTNSSAVRVEVPSHRLWRNVRVNGEALRPLPDKTDYVISGRLLSFSAGAFGEVLRPRALNDEPGEIHWSAAVRDRVVQMAGLRAANRLAQLDNKAQLLRWACEHNAHALLPKLMSLMSVGVVRGVL